MESRELLEGWIDVERTILGRVDAGRGPGVAEFSDIADKSGIEVMEHMLQGTLPYAEMARTLSFGAISVGIGNAVFQGRPQKQYLNPMGTVHGGWIGTVLDSAMGSAVLTLLPAGQGYLTTSLSVKFVRGLSLKVQRVRAEAKAVQQSEKLATAESRLVGPDGTVFAHATAECRIFETPKSPA